MKKCKDIIIFFLQTIFNVLAQIKKEKYMGKNKTEAYTNGRVKLFNGKIPSSNIDFIYG
jgi:hypothetical protein